MEYDYIKLGDSYELIKDIPDKSIDLVIIDPPYEIVGGGSGGIFGADKHAYHAQVKTLSYGIKNDILEQLVRVMKKINIYIWCNKNQLRQYIDFFGDLGANVDLLTWHKTNPIPTCNNKYLSDTEYCLYFREDGVKMFGSFDTKKKWWLTPINTEDKKLWGGASYY